MDDALFNEANKHEAMRRRALESLRKAFYGVFQKHAVNLFQQHAVQSNIVARLTVEVRRLRAGKFTDKEISQFMQSGSFQELCRNLPDNDVKAFMDGCDQCQRSLFGTCRTDEMDKVIVGATDTFHKRITYVCTN